MKSEKIGGFTGKKAGHCASVLARNHLAGGLGTRLHYLPGIIIQLVNVLS